MSRRNGANRREKSGWRRRRYSLIFSENADKHRQPNLRLYMFQERSIRHTDIYNFPHIELSPTWFTPLIIWICNSRSAIRRNALKRFIFYNHYKKSLREYSRRLLNYAELWYYLYIFNNVVLFFFAL